jgi:hypothetical protein
MTKRALKIVTAGTGLVGGADAATYTAALR